MALYMRVRCNNCRGDFDLYHKNMQEECPARCPYCSTQMTEKQWNGLVNCYNTMEDWNAQSAKSHEEHAAPGFVAEIRRHYVPRGKFNFI